MKEIFCVEGVFDLEHPHATVEPMLELLKRLGYCDEYQHRTCATIDELKYRLETDFYYAKDGSVLYFNTHGAKDQIWLQESDQPIGPVTLKEYIQENGANRCHIHFGGCSTFSGSDANLRDLMKYTGATSVSGYGVDVGWVGGKYPALTLELEFFGLLSEVNFERNTKDRAKKLRAIARQIDKRFPECKFRLLTRRYQN